MPPKVSEIERATMVLADQNASWWKDAGMMNRGWVLAPTGEPLKAIQMLTSGITSWRSMNQTFWLPFFVSYLAKAYADIGQVEGASSCIGEAIKAIETTGERWSEPDTHRIAGEIALLQADTEKAATYFELRARGGA
jgi:hypothetical protein